MSSKIKAQNFTGHNDANSGFGLPDPNATVQGQQAGQVDYNAMSSGQQMGNPQMTEQQMYYQQQMYQQQMYQQQQMGQQQYQNYQDQAYNYGMQGQPPQDGNEPPKKKSKLPLILLVLVGVVIIVAVLYSKGLIGKKEVKPTYEGSGREVLDNFLTVLNKYDAVQLDDMVGTENGDSYIAQEWAYVNGVPLREEFILKATGVVKFEYPTNKETGEVSLMNGDEEVTVTIPDYAKLTLLMDEEREYILKLFKSSKYSESDYTWNDEMTNLMLQYICDKEEIPTKTVKLKIPVSGGTLKSDADLDTLLFASDEFHDMCAKFSQICVGWTGYKDETYVVQEEQHNPEYDEWKALFDQYYNEDNGHFNKWTSKWEPWYLYDEYNHVQKDENGNRIVKYYSIKREDGTDWIQPDETIIVDVEKTRQVEDPWVEESVIPYNFIGTYYLSHEYTGEGDTTVRVGDGSIDAPAGVGTTIITEVKCTDGKYHDVKVALVGYWVGQDAIDYAEEFSSKNRGFTADSVIELICYEVKVENLEDAEIEFESEMTLADENTNISSRTGTMYGFTELAKLGAGESVIINDWATSTELDQKYACWGKDFNKSRSMVYFNILAGSGEIPTYSAYQEFTGESALESSEESEASGEVIVPEGETTTEGTESTSEATESTPEATETTPEATETVLENTGVTTEGGTEPPPSE